MQRIRTTLQQSPQSYAPQKNGWTMYGILIHPCSWGAEGFFWVMFKKLRSSFGFCAVLRVIVSSKSNPLIAPSALTKWVLTLCSISSTCRLITLSKKLCLEHLGAINVPDSSANTEYIWILLNYFLSICSPGLVPVIHNYIGFQHPQKGHVNTRTFLLWW